MASPPTSLSISTIALGLLLMGLGVELVGCKPASGDADTAGNTHDAAGAHESKDTEPHADGETGVTEPDPPPEHEPDDPRATAMVIARSPSPAAIAGQGTKSLGFRLDKISHLFSLAATAKLPTWGAAGEGLAKLVRDDDLDTAWRCDWGQAKPCVLGLALPESAKVEALRMYVAAGPGFREYTGHPRIAKVRVHTSAGYVDATLADGASHVYVRFDAPIETQTLAVEVLEVHAGKQDALVHIAEIEVYGTEGVPRQPIDLDPDYAWLSWETTAWSATVGNHSIRQVFLNFARPGPPESPPSSRRLLRASAAFGQAEDDYLLFERLHGTDCDEVRGSYVLFDKRNRMFYPLGDLGGAGTSVFRHAGGRGFAVGEIGEDVFTVKGVVEEAGELKWKRPPKQAPHDPAALLREWGFETRPMLRAEPISATVPGCHRAEASELASLPEPAPNDPSKWVVCAVGDDTLFASAGCGQPARAYQRSGGKLIGQHESKLPDARGLRLHRVGDRLLVELSAQHGDTSTLLWAEPGQLVELGAHAGLFIRPPAACDECSDDWHKPALSEDPLDEGEAWVDEGGEGDWEFEGEGEDEDEDEGEDTELPGLGEDG